MSGTSASVAFSSPDSDIAGFQCSLDGGAFAACASPKAFTGLGAGAHTVVVRPIDKAGNVGPTVSRTFSIASSQSGRRQQPAAAAASRRTSTRPRRR